MAKLRIVNIPVIMLIINIFLSFAVALLISISAIAADSALILNGNFVQGGLVFGQVTPGSKVIIDGHAVRVSADGDFIIGFGRDYPSRTSLKVIYSDGSSKQHELKIAQRKYEIQRIDGLPNDQVNPDADTLVRIKQEQREIRLARDIDEGRLDFKQKFIWPTEGPITGVYGSQRILNGQPRQPHYGIDVAAPVGTSVVAPASGVVSYIGDMYFSGWTVVLDHGHRLSSSFLHLDKVLVQVGDRIQQGETIALVGATGRVTGAHLDWRMNWHTQRIDPGLLVEYEYNSKKQ